MDGVREAVRALGSAGVVAIRECGHWWSYVFPMGAEQMHDLARLNARQPCPFCVAARRAHARTLARPPAERVH